MKLIHLADLHIGKRVNSFSMIEDQKYILLKILKIIDDEKPDAVLIAGDVYDRSIPPEEAVDLFDNFLVKLSEMGTQVYIINGNHDSASRVAFGGRLMTRSGVHFSPVYSGTITPEKLGDEYGNVNIWLIPFIKPAYVKRFHEEMEIGTYADAMKVVIDELPLNPDERNIAVSHQFITGASICDSEEKSVGGLDDIPAEVYAPFDYVALGHLHGPQKIGRDTIRYAGSPLKYSFSEVAQIKSVTVIEMKEKGCDIEIRQVPLHAMHDMIRLKGKFEDLMKDPEKVYDYYDITLTDEDDIPDAMNRLRKKFENIMCLNYDNTRTRAQAEITGGENALERHPLELFNELYEKQNGQSMSTEQQEFVNALITKIWDGEE